MFETLKRQKAYWALVGIVVLYIVLALPNSNGRSLYARSELVRDMQVVRSLDHGSMVWLGPVSSLGVFHFGPAYYFLLYPFAKLFGFRLALLPCASLAFGAASIVGIFFITKRWFKSEWAAYFSAVFMATSILSVQFGKYVSNPNFIPFFSLLFFYALERLFSNNKGYKYVLLIGLAFGISVQLHAVALVSLPLVLIFAAIRKDLRLTASQWSVFFLTAGALNLPYIFYELMHSFSNTRSLLHIGSSSNAFAPFSEHVLGYIGFWVTSIISAHSFYNVPLLVGRAFYIFFVSALILLYAVLKYNQVHLQPKNIGITMDVSVRKIMLYWLIVPSVVLLVPAGALEGLRIYYYFLLTPLVFILMSLGVVKLLEKGYNVLVYYILILYIIMQIGQAIYYNYLSSQLH